MNNVTSNNVIINLFSSFKFIIISVCFTILLSGTSFADVSKGACEGFSGAIDQVSCPNKWKPFVFHPEADMDNFHNKLKSRITNLENNKPTGPPGASGVGDYNRNGTPEITVRACYPITAKRQCPPCWSWKKS
jgi:hypothetical protein